MGAQDLFGLIGPQRKDTGSKFFMKGRDFFRQQRKGKDVIQLGQGVQFVFRCSVVPNIKGVSSKEPQMLQGQEKIQGPMYFKRGESLKKRTAAGAKAPHKGADFDAIMVTEGILPQEKGF